jgi:hypothetical protein
LQRGGQIEFSHLWIKGGGHRRRLKQPSSAKRSGPCLFRYRQLPLIPLQSDGAARASLSATSLTRPFCLGRCKEKGPALGGAPRVWSKRNLKANELTVSAPDQASGCGKRPAPSAGLANRGPHFRFQKDRAASGSTSRQVTKATSPSQSISGGIDIFHGASESDAI